MGCKEQKGEVTNLIGSCSSQRRRLVRDISHTAIWRGLFLLGPFLLPGAEITLCRMSPPKQLEALFHPLTSTRVFLVPSGAHLAEGEDAAVVPELPCVPSTPGTAHPGCWHPRSWLRATHPAACCSFWCADIEASPRLKTAEQG